MPSLLVLLAIGGLRLLGRSVRKEKQAMLDTHLDWLETELADRSWFAGNDFTAADVLMSFPLEVARQRGGLDASRPNLIDWLERIHARPAYGKALERGGPYSFA
jgi:glutathione S-transferase